MTDIAAIIMMPANSTNRAGLANIPVAFPMKLNAK
jgi:hypothetical protein